MHNTNHDSNRRKLLYIVTWNIGGLDYMVAVLWRLRTQYPNVDITVFFAEPHYDHVLRGGRFFLKLFDSLNIEYKDFRDLLHPFTKSLLKLVNPLLVLSPADYTTPMWIQRLQHLFNRFILSGQRFAEFLNSFEPDCIIIDDRKYYLRPFCGYKELETYYDAHPTLPIIQIPHAIKSEYYGDLFPNGHSCEIWLPLVAQERSYSAIRDLEHVYQTFVPSLDESWLNFIKPSRLHIELPVDKLTCVVLLEPFDMHQDQKRNKAKFLTSQDITYFIDTIQKTMQTLQLDIHFIIKPHPKQEEKILIDLLSQMQIKSYVITNEPSSRFLDADLCISMLTTAVYHFWCASIPTILILTETIHAMPLPDLYTNLTYACATSDEIANALVEILTKGHRDIERDYQRIRTYLPDHALDTVMDRLQLHLHLDN
jgi:hypothetical protein